MIAKARGLEVLVPSGTTILAAVRSDVFRREAEGKARRADEIAPVLLRMAPDIIVVLVSRLPFSTSVAGRHLLFLFASVASRGAFLKVAAVFVFHTAFDACVARGASQAPPVPVRVVPDAAVIVRARFLSSHTSHVARSFSARHW